MTEVPRPLGFYCDQLQAVFDLSDGSHNCTGEHHYVFGIPGSVIDLTVVREVYRTLIIWLEGLYMERQRFTHGRGSVYEQRQLGELNMINQMIAHLNERLN